MTYELLPPRGFEKDSIENIKPFASRLEAVTVTDNPMATLRASSIAYSMIAREALGIQVIPNLSCRDRNALGLQSEVIGAHLLGHNAIYIITGDSPRDRDGFKGVWEVNSTELCRIIKGMNNGQAKIRGATQELTGSTGFTVGGAIVFGRSNEVSTYQKKLDAGFDFFITQITFDADQVSSFYEEAEKAGSPLRKHVQIGVCPVPTLKKFKAVTRMPGVTAPDAVVGRLSSGGDFQGAMLSSLLELSDEVKSRLGGYRIGFHVMPIGSDEMGRKLVEDLTR